MGRNCSTGASTRPTGASRQGGALIVVLDTGGVESLVPADARRRARLREVRLHATDLVIPAAVLAEGLFTGHPGHDFHLGRLLAVADIEGVDRELGLRAGRFRQAALGAGGGLQPSGVDAVVVAVADERAAQEAVVIITSDVDDLTLLGSLCDNAERLSVQPA